MTVKTIILRGTGIAKEAIANAAITPGYLVEVMSTGNLRKHATAGGNAAKAFARENEVIGKGIDTDYAALDTALYIVAQPGAEVFALVPASAAAIVIGDFLQSNGDGTLVKHVAQVIPDPADTTAPPIPVTPNMIIGIAISAIDNSGGGTEARVKVEVL